MGKKRSEESVRKIISDMGYFLLDDYSVKGRRFVTFQDKDKYKYDLALENLIKENNPKMVIPTNPFALENISLWIKNNNKEFELMPENKYIGNKCSLYFKCYRCDEVFYATWNQIFRGGECCLCSGRQIGKKNNLEYLRPDLSEEWSDKNKLSSNELGIHSGKVVFWKCKTCSYEWKTKISKRVSGKSNCPSCSGRMLTDKNRLSLNFPELCLEWYPYKNEGKTPENISYGSRGKIWWKCISCNHEWEASLKSRTTGKRGCPDCANNQRESKIASEIKRYLEGKYSVIFEYKILKNPKTGHYLPYDIYIPDKNVFIEINGVQHYKINWFHRKIAGKKYRETQEEGFKYQKYKDRLKRIFAKQNGTYIEIDAREELDFENIINLIENR